MANKKTTKNNDKKYKKEVKEEVKKENKSSEKNGNNVPKNTISGTFMPYFLMIFSLVIAICFIIVQLLEMKDGAGAVGYAIQWVLCGLLGPAAFLLPVVIFYIGLKWCLYNIKLSRQCAKNIYSPEELVSDRRRTVIQTITGFLLIFFISVIIAVAQDLYPTFDVKSMWLDAANDLLGGGLFGSAVGFLMNLAFKQVLSIIILSLLSLITFVFMIGLTPDRIVEMIQDNREAKKQRRAEEAEAALKAAAEAEADARKHKNRIMMSTPEETEQKTIEEPSFDEIVSDNESEYKPLGAENTAESSSDADELYEALDVNSPKPIESEAPSENVGKDFGGDPAFDTNEYGDILNMLHMAGAQPPVEPEPVIDEPDDEPELDDDMDEIDILRDKQEEKKSEYIDLKQMDSAEIESDMEAVKAEAGEQEVEIVTPYVFPPVDMLAKNPNAVTEDYTAELQENAQKLMETLKSFKVSIKDITYSRGPTITRYELRPEAGTRVRAISNLVDDIALNLATTGVRIEAPIPNKPAVGIEVPNRTRATVYLRDLIDSPKFFEAKSRLTACLGMDVGGNPIYFDVSKMPHLLIAGATGMGKSVCINTIIVSMLYKAKPDELKLILIDPKKVEFTMYKNIPHLYAPIVSDPKKAAGALASAVAEMERRFEMIEDVGARDITGYNTMTENDPEKEFMPHMVIIIDELADLMMTAPDEVESSICRLAQKARAAGIHIIIGTQRPSVDVITGLLKANIPSRIACTVASQIDSRTILDIAGAEKLIGRGDMLFAPVGAAKPMRVQGAFVSEGEVEKIVTFIRDNNAAGKFNAEFIHMIDEAAANVGAGKKGAQGGMDAMPSSKDGGDDKFHEAVVLAIEEGKISTSLMQRRLGVGYGRAAKLIDEMEALGYVSKPDGNKPRRVLISMEEYQRRRMEEDEDM